jgi:cell division protein FtsW
MTRILRLPLPEPYSPTRVEALRDRLRSKPKPAKPPRTTNQKPSGGRGGRSAGPPAADRSGVKGRAGGRHHGGEQRYTDQRRASTGHGRGKGRVLEGQRYG